MHKISYIGDGVTTQYLFTFPFFQESDVCVSVDERALTHTQYGVYPNEDLTGGTVIFPTAPTEGARIDIFRQVTLSRVIDYQPTAKIDPEDLNTDFNFLLAALRDIRQVDIDLAQWQNTHDNVKEFLEYTNNLVQDKLSGGGVLGIYNNLVSVLAGALPLLINDYGYITDTAPNENRDDYGIL